MRKCSLRVLGWCDEDLLTAWEVNAANLKFDFETKHAFVHIYPCWGGRLRHVQPEWFNHLQSPNPSGLVTCTRPFFIYCLIDRASAFFQILIMLPQIREITPSGHREPWPIVLGTPGLVQSVSLDSRDVALLVL